MATGRHWQAASALALALATIPAAPAHADCTMRLVADLPVTMRGLRASVPVKVNGQDNEFWLDSGAWFSIMSKARATELALPLNPAPEGMYGVGVGGAHRVEVARIRDFGIVGQTLHNLEFLVGGSDTGNALIGRNILGIADTEFDLGHGSVRLIKSKGCEKQAMAYWAPGKPYFIAPMADVDDRMDFMLKVRINNAEIKAEVDSGAPYSLISQRAAERAGIDLKGAGVQPLDGIGGFGRKFLKGWSVPVDSVAIGEEQVLRTRLDVIEGTIAGSDGPDMLIGADFLLAHHVYFAREQKRMYFTYTGGKPFRSGGGAPAAGTAEAAGATGAVPAIPAGLKQVSADTSGAEPDTAPGFARRAAARAAARETALALADYAAAIALAPGDAALYRGRAELHGRAGNGKAARADFDKAIALAPGDPDLIRMRALLRHADGDDAGALADADADAAARVTHPATLDALPIADLFIELGQAARALPLWDALIAAHQADSRLPDLYNGRCWARGLAGQALPAALDDCNRALRNRPGNPGILDSRALVKFRMGDFAGALADYDAVLAVVPDLAWSHYMRGLTRIARGDKDAGQAERDAALKDKGTAARAGHYRLGG